MFRKCSVAFALGFCCVVAQSQAPIIPSNATDVNGALPIIIDAKHAGWNPANAGFDHFTDPNKDNGYVTFDIAGTGQMAKFSWPQHDSGLMWLALPDDNGTVASGKQLFGNFTPHSDGAIPGVANSAVKSSSDYNGFLALRWYDLPDNGGNADGVIDSKDAVWPKLRLWEDSHCWKDPDAPCQSQPEELHTLESLGIDSLALIYNASQVVDKYGNLFKFYALVNPDVPRDAEGNSVSNDSRDQERTKEAQPRYAFDVYLAVRGKQ